MSPSHLLRSLVRISLPLSFVVISTVVPGCSGASASGDTGLVVEISLTGISVENQTGTTLTKGEVSVIPGGIPQPYVTLLSHMSNGEKRTFPLNSFRTSDGTPLRPDVANPRSVKVTATDIGGAVHEREVPYK
jgi:hypothetical protein